MNPFERLAREFAHLLIQGQKLRPGPARASAHPQVAADAPVALIFSPHPDDECIIGALPLRLRNEARLNVINVAVTLGGKKSRRAARRKELAKACRYLGFGLTIAGGAGLEKVKVESRGTARWKNSVNSLTEILGDTHPRIVFVPHANDGHPTHVGTHHLVLDALARMPRTFQCLFIETEFWRAMDSPNLMVESNPRDVGALMAALSFHTGEVRRNPYHLRLPAWLQDNVRRGAELLGGRGAAAPDFAFATLYRLRRWNGGNFTDDPAAAVIHAAA
jgi:LmbE family N-acetylglucosaminyl deacetylase